MGYGELYLEPEPQKLKNSGRFQKGNIPFNKGKKWSEYVSKRSQKRMAKGWKNLELYRPKTRPDVAGRTKKPVIALFDNGEFVCYGSITGASIILGACRENIRRCCKDNQKRHINKKTGNINTDHRHKGIRFYYEDDDIWMKKI